MPLGPSESPRRGKTSRKGELSVSKIAFFFSTTLPFLATLLGKEGGSKIAGRNSFRASERKDSMVNEFTVSTEHLRGGGGTAAALKR